MVTGEASPRYDEVVLGDRLRRLPAAAQVAFAASCAERLMPVYAWAVGTNAAKDVDQVRAALDLAWSAESTRSEVEEARATVEDLVPGEDDKGFSDVALSQNAVACVVYVLRAWLSLDARDAVWAARQLYEAADHLVQLTAPSQTYIENVAEEAPVQLVIRGMTATLADLDGRAQSAQVRARARADGDALAALLKEG